MSYCKKCICGHLNIYEISGCGPSFCTNCGRELFIVTEEIYNENQINVDPNSTVDIVEPSVVLEQMPRVMQLVDENGNVIIINEKTIVGRLAAGQDFLGNLSYVSRQHFIIEPRVVGFSAYITDISTFGTYYNGKKLEKNIPVVISNGAEIQLVNGIKMKFVIK